MKREGRKVRLTAQDKSFLKSNDMIKTMRLVLNSQFDVGPSIFDVLNGLSFFERLINKLFSKACFCSARFPNGPIGNRPLAKAGSENSAKPPRSPRIFILSSCPLW